MHWLTKDFNLVHGNINLSTVYVTKQGDWRLGGLDLVSPISEVKSGNALIFQHQNLATNLQWSPEMQAPPEKALPALNESPNSAIDTWLLGVLIWHLYNHQSVKNGASSFDRNRLKELTNIPASLQDDYAKLLTGSPRARLALDKFLESAYFETPFVQTCLFLENLMLKDAHEKEKFFKNANLPKLVAQFPEAMAKYKILPMLTTNLDFGGADHNALPLTLTLAAKLTTDEYKAQMTPSVLKWFTLPDRTLRLCLLSNLETIIPHLDSNHVSTTIWTPLSQGFTDSVPQLREATVKSLIHFAPKLSERIINGDLLKFLATLQVDPVPGIRCNTTICLGKLASMLTPSVRQKVLFQAFGRALKDPFPPSRKAALSAMAHCHEQGYFSAADIASRVLPATAPMCLDLELTVRTTAIQSIQSYLKTLEAESARMPATAPTPDAKAQEEASVASGVFDWALGKVLGTNIDPAAAAAAKATGAKPSASVSSAFSASGPSSSASLPSSSTPKSSSTTKSTASVPAQTTSAAFKPQNAPGEVPWDDEDDTGDFPPVGRPKHLPTHNASASRGGISNSANVSSQQTYNANRSNASGASTPKSSSLTPSSSSQNVWGESNGWGNDDEGDISGWGDDTGDFPAPLKSHTAVQSHSRSSSTNSTSTTTPANAKKSMSIVGKSQPSTLSAWDDTADEGNGWGDDFATTTITRGKPNSRFG